MNGYIARKGDRWYAVVYEGVDPETGKERRRWVDAGRSSRHLLCSLVDPEPSTG